VAAFCQLRRPTTSYNISPGFIEILSTAAKDRPIFPQPVAAVLDSL
jgi:hypothetical protein